MPTSLDEKHLRDLAVFARIETESGDVEPWAEMIRTLRDMGSISDEESLWVLKLYNAYDSFHSAWGVFRRWNSPEAWVGASDRIEAASFDCTQERRGLRGGRVLQHLASYLEHLQGQTQRDWVTQGIYGDDPERDFARMTSFVRSVWGVGRQTAFEWAEFLGKVGGLPIRAGDAQLWESEGPRRCLQRLYGNPTPTPEWLDARATECRDFLRSEGVDLEWWDF